LYDSTPSTRAAQTFYTAKPAPIAKVAAELFSKSAGKIRGDQSTRDTLKSCDELTVLFDLAFVAFKSFAVVGDFDIAHIKLK